VDGFLGRPQHVLLGAGLIERTADGFDFLFDAIRVDLTLGRPRLLGQMNQNLSLREHAPSERN